MLVFSVDRFVDSDKEDTVRYPNFAKIKNIKNPFLRIALYTAKDDSEVDSLLLGFGEYYTNDPDNLCVPVSVLRRDMIAHPETDWEDEPELWWNPEKFGVPEGFRWSNDPETGRDPVPAEVAAQLEGVRLRGGIVVKYMGEEFVIFRLDVDGCEIGDPISTDKIGLVAAVHSRFIDLNS